MQKKILKMGPEMIKNGAGKYEILCINIWKNAAEKI